MIPNNNLINLLFLLSSYTIEISKNILEKKDTTESINLFMGLYEIFLDNEYFTELPSNKVEYNNFEFLFTLSEIPITICSFLKISDLNQINVVTTLSDFKSLNQVISELYTMLIIEKFSVKLKKNIKFSGYIETEALKIKNEL